ncbi:WD repeat-containing protein 89 [Drosophila tropicalis]|uniref:WD repeat-containing protein 89 n=1 Tax=Drosophila tropicalis TaxID=46794 RepID=UPI0035AC14C0
MADNFNKYCHDAVKKELPNSDDEEEEAQLMEDGDICENVVTEFPFQFNLKDEIAVSLQQDYVLSLGADTMFTRLAVGLSNNAVQIHDINSAGSSISNSYNLMDNGEASKVCICGLRFLDDTPNLLLVGSTDGPVRLFDLRTSAEQAKYEYKTKSFDVPKSITSFDSNANGRIICCGTEQYMSNVFLLFFDVRTRKQMGAFFESHEKDVTSVRFHKNNPDILCSGSVDGLINIFDIKESDEDEALQNTINTESSVYRLNWHKNVYEKDIISCITQTNDFKSYECGEGDEIVSFERPEIVAGIRRINPGNFNLINAHNMTDNSIFLLAGTNHKDGEILRSVGVMKKKLQPLANFTGNKQIVRDSLFDAKRNLLFTGGECGFITLWTSDAVPQTITSSGKMKVKTKSNKMTPY